MDDYAIATQGKDRHCSARARKGVEARRQRRPQRRQRVDVQSKGRALTGKTATEQGAEGYCNGMAERSKAMAKLGNEWNRKSEEGQTQAMEKQSHELP